jgi:hypothetical protein
MGARWAMGLRGAVGLQGGGGVADRGVGMRGAAA